MQAYELVKLNKVCRKYVLFEIAFGANYLVARPIREAMQLVCAPEFYADPIGRKVSPLLPTDWQI